MIDERCTFAEKEWKNYEQIIQLAERQEVNNIQNNKSLTVEFAKLKNFKQTFEDKLNREIQPKMSDLSILDEQSTYNEWMETFENLKFPKKMNVNELSNYYREHLSKIIYSESD